MPIGVDVSKWNVSSDGKTMWNPNRALKPIDFVIQRVSYGGSSGSQVKDELLEPMYAMVQQVPVRGATKVTAPSATMSYTLDTSTNWVISVCTVEPVTAGANFFAFF